MSIIAEDLPGARVLDLFAGSGALGLEALSRGAAHATFVENAPAALPVLRANLESLQAGSRADLVRADALRFISGLREHAFDIALADPPYGLGLAASLVGRHGEIAFAPLLCIEHRRDEQLPEVAGAWHRRYGDTVITFVRAL